MWIFIIMEAIDEAQESAEEDEPETPNLFVSDLTMMSLGTTLISAIVALTYFTYFESRTGQSLGKKLLNIRVTKPDLSPIGMEEALKRNIARWLWSVPVVGYLFLIVDLILILTGERQRIGDRFAGTVVISAQTHGPHAAQGYGPGPYGGEPYPGHGPDGYPPPGPPGYPPNNYPPSGQYREPPPDYGGYEGYQGQGTQDRQPYPPRWEGHPDRGGHVDERPSPYATEYKPDRENEAIKGMGNEQVRDDGPIRDSHSESDYPDAYSSSDRKRPPEE